jgi:predicted carbohydrate-binding protein with CBM5 and CBM33 domain
MTARRTSAALAALATGSLLPLGLLPSPAQAHGAPSTPVSRAYACGAGTAQQKTSAACKAAIAAGAEVAEWDNIRVANVNGRDRQVIPDGKLCSAGLATYQGLDLARSDWPSTKLTPGSGFTFSYKETIAHKGTFRLYVTKDGYSPTKPLRWADLESAPFATVTDPVLDNRAYVIKGALPKNKSGQHLIYTIWQNSSTADTYYSCSDVVFTVVGSPSRSASSSGTGGAKSQAASAPAAAETPAATSPAAPNLVATSSSGIASTPVLAGVGGAVVLALAGGAAFVLLRRRRSPGLHVRR